MNKSKIVIIIICLLVVIGIVYCLVKSTRPSNNLSEDNNVTTENKIQNNELTSYPITHDEKYGGVYVEISGVDFNKLGFQYGDSVDVSFSNGYKLEDIPYYNGYYTDEGDALLVDYPSNEYIRVGINYGDDVWVLGNLTESESCSITLNESGKYKDTQLLRDISYSNEQGDQSDEVFGNFRAMNVGNLKENMIFRGASPIDNTNKRAKVVDKLISGEKIAYILDLADNDDELMSFSQAEDFDSPYFMNLYNNNKVNNLDMNIQYKTEVFSQKLAQGLTDMAQNDGPYYIHCQEGKDRTGYVCMVVEAFGGASYQEIIDDYMKTYENYYDITSEKDNVRYEIIKEKNIDMMLKYVTEAEEGFDLSTIDLKSATIKYLQRIGMSDEAINQLESKICK